MQPPQEEEKELTAEERLPWLRARGIMVETPEERRAKAVAEAMKEANRLSLEDIDVTNDEREQKHTSQTMSSPRQPFDCKAKHQADGYSWQQSEEELEVTIVLSSNNEEEKTSMETSTPLSSKGVNVAFQSRSLSVTFRKVDEEPRMIQLALFEEIVVDGCTWELDRSSSGGGDDDVQLVVVTMEKKEQAYWPRIID